MLSHSRLAEVPREAFRQSMTLNQILRIFPDDQSAEAGLIRQRWPSGVTCPHCGSSNVQTGCKHKTMPFRCRERVCGRKRFSTKTGTAMEGSKIGYRNWVSAALLVMTSRKRVSTVKLHRDLGITQKSAWLLAKRLRVAFADDSELFSGLVKTVEAQLGSKRKNMGNAAPTEPADSGRSRDGKTAVVSAKDRGSTRVAT